MPALRTNPVKDLLLRVLGLALVAIACFAARRLDIMVHWPPSHEGSPAEMAVGTVSFLCASAGATLVFLGIHIFDEVAISPRWADRSTDPRARSDL